MLIVIIGEREPVRVCFYVLKALDRYLNTFSVHL